MSDTGDVGPADPDAGGGAPDSGGAGAGNGGRDVNEGRGAAGNGDSRDVNDGRGAAGNGGGAPDSDGAGAGNGGGAADNGGPADPRELLSEVRAIRRRARLARHGYWFPLVLFGLLTVASVPFYIRHLPATRAAYGGVLVVRGGYKGAGPLIVRNGYLGGFGLLTSDNVAYYWLGAMLVGIAGTVIWYRWRGDRTGLRTPARGYLITGLILVALALLIPLLIEHVPVFAGLYLRPLIMPGDLLVRGTFPFVLIGLGLCFLAWAERSVGLAVIAAFYLSLSLVASLYDIENVFYKLGWALSFPTSGLPNVVLPALVLLLSGAGAWVVQRRHRRPAEPAAEG